MSLPPQSFPGRGAGSNPPNRFESLRYEPDPPETTEQVRLTTEFLRDSTQSIIARNDSPDIGFDASINPYRGCEHGCAYCYARPFHEYLGFSAGIDFESKILIKTDAPVLLRKELALPGWKPQVVALSGVTDCYQPIERRLGLTRACLQVLSEFRNPVSVITKNHLVTRDVDHLSVLAGFQACAVTLSITTLDVSLASKLEPRASTPRARLSAIAELARARIPIGVNVAPIIPGLNDHEVPDIIAAAAAAGAQFAYYTVLRLPYAVRPIFIEWLKNHYPGHADKVLSRIQSIRDGKLNESRFGSRMRGSGIFAEQIAALFQVSIRKHGLKVRRFDLNTQAFRRVLPNQLQLL